jgi:hypothetical protein
MEEIQQAYEDQQSESVNYGGHHFPPCPLCGHHTVAVKLHGYRAAV